MASFVFLITCIIIFYFSINIFLKALEDNSFDLLYKLNQSISLTYKYIESILLCSFFCYKIFFELLSILYQNFIICFLNIIYLSLKNMHLVSSKSILYAFASGKNMHKGLNF